MSAIVHIDEAVGKTYSVFIATGGATEYLVRSNANLETQPRRNARDGGRAPGRVSYRPYLDRHGFGACDLQFEAWAGEASVRLGGALVAGGLAYVALTGTPSPNCSAETKFSGAMRRRVGRTRKGRQRYGCVAYKLRVFLDAIFRLARILHGEGGSGCSVGIGSTNLASVTCGDTTCSQEAPLRFSDNDHGQCDPRLDLGPVGLVAAGGRHMDRTPHTKEMAIGLPLNAAKLAPPACRRVQTTSMATR